MLTDGHTDGRTDDGRKVITIAHPEQSSGELIKVLPKTPPLLYGDTRNVGVPSTNNESNVNLRSIGPLR